MQKPEIVACMGVDEVLMQRLEARFAVHRLWTAADPQAMLRAVGERVGALFTLNLFGADAALMDALPRLGLIACFGAGYDRVDLAAAQARGIRVTNSPGATAAAVAEIAIGLLLSASRGICAGDRMIRAGGWPQNRLAPLRHELNGRRLGILGLGAIGGRVAAIGEALGMEIGYHNRRPVAGSPHRHVPSPAALADWSDHLVVSCPGGAETRGLVDARVLEHLGPAGILVNVARGSVVDQDALVAALALGRIAAAGLDVFAAEPFAGGPLLDLPNVVTTPHCGGRTHEAFGRMMDNVIANLDAHFAGRPLVSAVA